MRRTSDFASVVRTGARGRSGPLVLHQRLDLGQQAPLVGFVVGRSVGGSVQRHLIARRLRAQMAARLDRLPTGSGTVVRVLPEGAGASSAALGAELDRALVRLAGRR